jgi:hypothetical protein
MESIRLISPLVACKSFSTCFIAAARDISCSNNGQGGGRLTGEYVHTEEGNHCCADDHGQQACLDAKLEKTAGCG